MYLISQVSKITGLTNKALRYYDEQDILKPSVRDEDSQYRLYSEDDLRKARLIHLLRQLDFSISEIKDTLQVSENEEDLAYVFREKIEHIEGNIAKEKEMIKNIKNVVGPLPNEKKKEKHEITIETIDPIKVASVRVKDAYNQVGKYLPNLYKEVKQNVNGNMLNCYYDEDFAEIADIEICIPVRNMISGTNLSCKVLPAIKAVCTIHYGTYETLYCAYKELFEYINENKINVVSPSREEYIKGPGMLFKGNPNKYITKIMIPYED